MDYRILLVGMAFAAFLVMTAVAMMGPLLVDMADALTVSVPVAAQLVTTAAAAWAATALFVGPFSDAYGRKPVLLLGNCCVAVGSLGLELAPSFAVAAGFSILVGIGGGWYRRHASRSLGISSPNRESLCPSPLLQCSRA